MTVIFDLEAVGYDYLNSSPALRDITFSIAAGKSIAILGANGSGKSTLLKLLDGLYFPVTGEIRAFGVLLTEAQFRNEAWAFGFRRRVGLLFQNPDVQLFLPTVRDEVAFAPLQLGLSRGEVSVRVESALTTLGIARLADRAPYNLSEGEKKKVAIASVLSLDPDVWLLDEPLASLDPRTGAWMMDFLFSLVEQGKTLVIATHNLAIARNVAHQACVLDETHRLIAHGQADVLLDNKALLLQANLIYNNGDHVLARQVSRALQDT